MKDVIFEFSDACAVLGSGQEKAIANYDKTEAANGNLFIRDVREGIAVLSERLGADYGWC